MLRLLPAVQEFDLDTIPVVLDRFFDHSLHNFLRLHQKNKRSILARFDLMMNDDYSRTS